MLLFFGLILAGFHFLLAYYIWKKGNVHLLAGYVEGQERDKKKLAQYSGIHLIILGIVSGFFVLLDSFFVVLTCYIVACLVGVVIINVKLQSLR